MADYLVTGGAGFVGTLLVKRLLQDGHRVVSIDLVPATITHSDLNSVQGDIRDRSMLDRVFSRHKVAAVFHCAALLAHGSISKAELMSHNAYGTQVLAEAVAAAGVPKVIYLSSNCLWARDFDHPVDEAEPPSPIEPYGVSKYEGERILSSFADAFDTVTIRCPTIIDEGRLGLLAILFEFIADGNRLWMVGNGTNRYQFIYAADLLDAMLRAVRHNSSMVCGIGSDNVPTMAETFEYVIRKSGSRSRIQPVPRGPMVAAMRLAHWLRVSPLGPYHYRMIDSSFIFDTQRIKQALGWQPTLTNGEMLFKAYCYYRDNRDEISTRKNVSAHRQAAKMGAIRLLKALS